MKWLRLVLLALIAVACGICLGVTSYLNSRGYFSDDESFFSDEEPKPYSRVKPPPAFASGSPSPPTQEPPRNRTARSSVQGTQPASNSSSAIQIPGQTHADDEDLFRRALLATKTGNVPKPKLAFLFLTRGPLPLAPLWNIFLSEQKGLYSVYIHNPNPSSALEQKYPKPFKRRTVPSKRVGWGEITVADAERRLLANALLDPANERFILLSESCVPVFNFTFIYNYLLGTSVNFIRVIEDPKRSGRNRWNKHFLPLVPVDQWRKGHQWFAITREAATAIVGDTKFYPLFRDHCKGHCYSDEHYFHTLLSALLPQQMSNKTLTFTDWSSGGAHPMKFTRTKISKALIDKIRGRPTCKIAGLGDNYCWLFARKFAPDSLAPLLFLSSYMGF